MPRRALLLSLVKRRWGESYPPERVATNAADQKSDCLWEREGCDIIYMVYMEYGGVGG